MGILSRVPVLQGRQEMTAAMPERMFVETSLCRLVCPIGDWTLKVGNYEDQFSILPPLPASVSAGPVVKRPRLDVVKRLNFEPDMEELLYPDSPPGDITPPPSPEVFPEMWDAGCVI